MGHTCLVGKSDMREFTPWWESHLPAWIIIYCIEGEAELSLLFRRHEFRQGMATIIPPDMFPSFISASNDFNAFFCLIDRDFAENAFYDVPQNFFGVIYAEPILTVHGTMPLWTELMSAVFDDTGNPYREQVLSNILRAFALDFQNKWQLQYGNLTRKNENNSAEAISMKFYDLVFDHFREHRNTAFYADKLCITPSYLAMVIRQICHETPKQAIDRQVSLEMKYMLRNTNMTMGEIANALHFPDTSYMCRFFRRITGFSLSEYRNSNV